MGHDNEQKLIKWEFGDCSGEVKVPVDASNSDIQKYVIDDMLSSYTGYFNWWEVPH